MITQKLSISTDKFIHNYLPEMKRQANRKAVYEAMLEPYRVMNEEWKVWRDAELIRSKVTIQKASIEWYLNRLFDDDLERIYIVRSSVVGLSIGKNKALEPAAYQSIGNNEATEPSDYVSVPLTGEDAVVGPYRFAVFIPTALSSSTEAIKAVVSNYNSSKTDFTVIEF